ncbi:Uncharacterized conserved protein, Ntn-hydrolase superfamily [Halogranum gelatinilyticum]|uniref:Uncharacterized conserved protein, Ntn-hydrolase superfamily n=1 Tax=Halogranum gelatinilyticum TaxID=660521 RepID=A0A1G9ZD10_9EURY|nr:DUF1028 domain-containing protein [Halogranum gelatinilyticum]SDN18343.1 Uncharacterized conserved protein, Ntn-hydrolase superfamily [Halogranum gelatinilyticum]
MTFSICVREETDDGTVFGVAVATDAPAVGALAPCISHEGVISTQSFVNVRLGRRGVELLSDLAVDDALTGLLEQDDHSDLRQVHGLDARGTAFAFSGDECDGWFGHEVHEEAGITAAGNMLATGETLPAAVEAYQSTEGQVGERLVAALAAGKEAGGDKRGHTSAALKVKAPETTIYHDLRVDEHETPIAELQRVYDAARTASEQFTEAKKSRIFD